MILRNIYKSITDEIRTYKRGHGTVRNVTVKTFAKTQMSFIPPFVGSIDNGTSSTRFIVFDSKGSLVAQSQKEFPNYYPKEGWCEHDPTEIYEYTKSCIATVCEQVDPKLIKAVGITNQRETTVVWDKITGEPLHRAIVWLDTRTRQTVKDCVQKSGSQSVNHFKEKCGLPFSTYFSALKLKWLLENVDAVKLARDENRLMVGTIDTWLLYKFSGGKEGGVYYTDVTNASRTMLMNLKTLNWDPEICDFFEISTSCLPEIKSSSEIYGFFRNQGFLDNVPIAGILGDQQAALVGQLCFRKGMLKNTYGTGCFMLCNTGTDPVQSTHGLLTTVGYKLGPNAPCFYALEGAIAIAGASVRWLRDNLGLISEASQIGIESDKVENNGGMYFVPAFSGLFAPHWRDDARGTMVGMTLATTKSHICRATLEAVAFQTKDIMDSMSKDMNDEVKLLRVDGGMAASEQLMQIQADIAGIDLHRPSMVETTALGAALSAGLAVQVWDSLESFASGATMTVFKPKISKQSRQILQKGWHNAIEKSIWM